MTSRKAFTLMEMVVVLAVIALVTHLAVREMAGLLETRRAEAANRLLDDVRLAVYSECEAGGSSTGFLADMGRLPRPAPAPLAEGGEAETLSELWRIPAGARPFAVRQASLENLSVRIPGLVASNVYVATGWRGPYLRLGPGRSRLADPWGNPMELVDSAGLERLFVTNGFITAAAHYGRSGQRGADDARTVSLVPAGASANGGGRLAVTVTAWKGDGTPVPPTACELRLYSPGPDGLIAVAAVSNVVSSAVFEDVKPGVHMLWDDKTKNARRVAIRPGGGAIELKLPVSAAQEGGGGNG